MWPGNENEVVHTRSPGFLRRKYYPLITINDKYSSIKIRQILYLYSKKCIEKILYAVENIDVLGIVRLSACLSKKVGNMLNHGHTLHVLLAA